MSATNDRPFSLDDLDAIVRDRKAATSAKSYTKSLLDKGAVHCAKKFGEEAVEFVIATTQADRSAVKAEAAEVPLQDVLEELQRRTSMSGHEEKAARG
jgi:phosphoribosyl-ATP pyrophosphohydrolase